MGCSNSDNYDPGADGSAQVFRYVATGAEAAQFTVVFPAVRPSVNYNVQLTSGGPVANAFKDARALVTTFTVAQFDVEMPVAPQAGDILMITVEDLT